VWYLQQAAGTLTERRAPRAEKPTVERGIVSNFIMFSGGSALLNNLLNGFLRK
jgi:hypothetical protein